MSTGNRLSQPGIPRVNGQRLWESLMEMAAIGATPKGGNCRLALSDPDRVARDLFVRWAQEAGCAVVVDRMGNIFARRAGLSPELPPVMSGSHLDTQPTGGKFDGVYGVLAGLEVIRTLNDRRLDTQAPVELVVWTNEEGSRFPPAMIGSGVFAGIFTLAYGHDRQDLAGLKLGEELARIGYAGTAPCDWTVHPARAYFEAHIEQGPILEASGATIGVVSGAQGQRWFELTIVGSEAHAGTTPMDRRADALLAASRVVLSVNEIARRHGPLAVGTVGLLKAEPNSRNTIPGSVFMSVDLRHPDDDTLSAMAAQLKAAIAAIHAPLRLELQEIWYSPPVRFDAQCVGAVRDAAQGLGLKSMTIVSGAGHDACYVASRIPTAMIFIPCENGISHNEIEAATPADIEAGANVLFAAVAGTAGIQ